MAHKQVLFRSEAREKVLKGASQLADAVRVTLGPRSKSVLIERKWGTPIVCNDGVTIAKEFDLRDPEENLGARMLRQAAEKTGDMVGDGTSTSTVLAHAMLADGIRNVVAGASAIDIKRGLDRATGCAVETLRSMSRQVNTRREKEQVATISAHNDAGIGQLVGDAMDKVGGEGVITVEESKTTETVLEVVEGMQFDRGFLSPYFVTDAEKMEAIPGRCARADRGPQGLWPAGFDQIVRSGGQGRSTAVGRSRRCRRGSFGDAHRQPDSRSTPQLRRQSAWIWRPSEGDD